MNYLTRNSQDFRREFERLFDDFWPSPSSQRENAWSPLSEVEEEGDHFMLSMEVPGMSREDLKIEVVNNQVMISGEKKSKDKSFSESRKFHRSFSLPTHVDAEKIEAQCQDGILKVYVPKAENAKPRQIQIGDGNSGFFGRLLGKKDDNSKSRVA
jgi:HSP20 family protein